MNGKVLGGSLMGSPVECGLHGEMLGVAGGFRVGDGVQLCLPGRFWIEQEGDVRSGWELNQGSLGRLFPLQRRLFK